MVTKREAIILVSGVTGNQGGATARHLLANGWRVRGLTRDARKPTALAFAEQGVEIVEGHFDDRASLVRALEGVYGVFSVQSGFEAGLEAEERWGKAFADAAQAAAVQHFVYSSVGSAEKNTGIPHFESKRRIEEYLQALGLPATILRPVFFMENFNFMARQSVFEQGKLGFALRPAKKLQMLAVDDVGAMAALVFENPEHYIGQAMEIAGDELTMPEIAELLSRVTGGPVTFEEQPLEPLKEHSYDFYVMQKWFNEVGYQADIARLRRLHPSMQTFEQWLQRNGWASDRSAKEQHVQLA
jgi:uncharacterized protein YbjT (DUF2867 family)